MRSARRPSPIVYAVLSGDIIGSTALTVEQLADVAKVIEGAFDDIRARCYGGVQGSPDFFRGDAWQVVLSDPSLALRASLLTRARLRSLLGIDSRISIGIGSVDRLVKARISRSTGEAFTLSGRALDRMTSYFDLTGALPDRAGIMSAWFTLTLHLCSGLMRTWTRRQAENVALALVLQDPKHEVIAQQLRPPVSKQTVTRSLASANWRPLLDALRTFESTNWGTFAGTATALAQDSQKRMSGQ
jgi:hypothetical protein